ncbi:MAG: ankyrin repeat domain-containing protein [Flavobacteriales bacterium]
MVRLLLILLLVSPSYFAQDIFEIARKGNRVEMEKFLKKHPQKINEISAQGASAFLLAAYHGNNEVASLLIEKGADLKNCYPQGSVVYALIYKNNLALLEEILKKGVNPNDTCQFEQMGYPLHFAMTLQRYEVIQLLLKYQVHLEVLDQQGRSIQQLLVLYGDPKLNEILNPHEK